MTATVHTSPETPTSTLSGRRARRPWWIPPFLGSVPDVGREHLDMLGIVSLGLLFDQYDFGMLSAALPRIAANLHIADQDLGYTLSLIRFGAVAAFLVGRRGNFGRNVIMACLAAVVINLLLRNSPAFRETNLFDALKFVLVGGRGDSVVLDNAKEEKSDYAGLVSVQGRRRAIILVASGIDTFSKINQSQARKIVQDAGIPIYIIGTGNLFLKKYDHLLDPGRGSNILGIPLDRMSFLQANNILGTFAKDTGGAFYPITFAGELPKVLGSINALLRSQYSLAFNPGDVHDGKQHKIKVSVDVDGDGVVDDKEYVIQARSVYNAPKPDAVTKQ